MLFFFSPSLADLSDSYTAPQAPRASYRPSYSAPAKPSYSAPSPSYQTVEVELPDYDYYKHEQHHFYHAGPPRVFHVKVTVESIGQIQRDTVLSLVEIIILIRQLSNSNIIKTQIQEPKASYLGISCLSLFFYVMSVASMLRIYIDAGISYMMIPL